MINSIAIQVLDLTRTIVISIMFVFFVNLQYSQGDMISTAIGEVDIYNSDNSNLFDGSVECIAIDSSNNIWCGGYSLGYDYLSIMAEILGDSIVDSINYSLGDTVGAVLDDSLISLFEDSLRGRSIAGGAVIDGGISTFNGSTWSVYNTENSSIPSDHVTSIAVDRENRVWAGTRKGLAYYHDNKWDFFSSSNSPLQADKINNLAFDTSGALWITYGNASTGGLMRYNNGNWENYNTENSPLPHNFADGILIDNNNVKWIGTSEGLVRLKHGNWSIYDNTNTMLEYPNIEELSIDTNGIIYAGQRVFYTSDVNHELELFRISGDGESWSKVDLSGINLTSVFTSSIAVDNKNRVWFASMLDDEGRNDLSIYNHEEWVVLSNADSLFQGLILEMVSDTQNNMWLASSNGVICISESCIDSLFETNQPVKSPPIQNAMEHKTEQGSYFDLLGRKHGRALPSGKGYRGILIKSQGEDLYKKVLRAE